MQTYKALTCPESGVCKSYPTDFQTILSELISAVTTQPLVPSTLANALYDLVGFGLYLAFGEVPATDVGTFLTQLENFIASFSANIPSWAAPLIQLAIQLFTAFLSNTPVVPAVNPPVG